MAVLDDALTRQLSGYLEHVREPVELVCSLDDSEGAARMRALLDEICALSPKVTVRFDGKDTRRPSFQVTRAGADMGVRFAAVPLGHEFSSLVLALLQAGGHPPKVAEGVVEQVRALGTDGDEYVFETYMSLTCHNCPDVVQALNLMAVLNPRVRHTAVDGSLFRAEVDERQVMAVPMVYLNGTPFGSGRMDLAEILRKVDSTTNARDAARLATKDVFDVLVVGGGPAGATAAVYAARKGIATGVVAERFGGQTLDTLGIENFPSVLHTEGPRFAAALEAHARAYDVDVMTGQVATALTPPATPGGPVVVTLENGAMLHGRTVVLAPGARWRSIGVPGEDEYRTKGVAYCPSCDGPLYKGRRVAVVGGGNSGVEAAIDLAGVVEHVTLLEFTDRLNADQVLVDRLLGLRNATVVTSAQTTEVVGDGTKVTGLAWTDRTTGAATVLPVAGVFVQIGLVPSTEWLEGAVALSRTGEIVVDARGATSVPGVFAAGDATTTPFKQIVIAAGEGAKAALSAFDHLIRGGAPHGSAQTAQTADGTVDLRGSVPAQA